MPGQYFLKFCQTTAGPYNDCITNVGMNAGKVKVQQAI